MCEIYLHRNVTIWISPMGCFESLLLLKHSGFEIAIYLHSRAAMQVFPHGSGKRRKSFHHLSPANVFQDNICMYTYKWKLFTCSDLWLRKPLSTILPNHWWEGVSLPYTYHSINRIEFWFLTLSYEFLLHNPV